MRSTLDSLWVLEKKYRNLLTKMTKSYRLTIAEWQLLIKINDGLETQEQFAAEFKVNLSTLSRQLNRLLVKRFIRKTATSSSKGRGQYIYTITEEGKRTIQMMRLTIADFEERLFARWSDEETALLKLLLNRLVQSMARLE
ncbi:helix-turn-helix transcriptional regulator [Liquorilactobacillus capillatus]|uniref:HTH marR-type domain-containing protein n=1 Tax=Liquorilactobacillus capillatus DSM 19910 TaxID=1423731 RepID=A0A0R1M8T6_9LACO|nr:helix-turn-helix transcriptional regulator [Liquorilactobacillus capillatus]KRL01178.1 hypothetical protein FC81_GL001319 [Liquorilactobacillus capillatus DSM 19910]